MTLYAACAVIVIGIASIKEITGIGTPRPAPRGTLDVEGNLSKTRSAYDRVATKTHEPTNQNQNVKP